MSTREIIGVSLLLSYLSPSDSLFAGKLVKAPGTRGERSGEPPRDVPQRAGTLRGRRERGTSASRRVPRTPLLGLRPARARGSGGRRSSRRGPQRASCQRLDPARRGAASRRSRGSRRARPAAPWPPRGPPRLGAEAAADDLEHVAQSLGGDPHVVLGARRAPAPAPARRSPQLGEPGADDPGRVGAQRRLPGPAPRPCAPSCLSRLRPASSRRRRSFFSRLRGRRTGPAPRWRCRCSSRRASIQRRERRAVALARLSSANSSRNSIATSRSRRSPSASASALTRFSALRWRLRGKQGSKTSSAARRRRVATRMSCTRSMSSRSSTPSACSKTSAARTSTTRAAATRRTARRSRAPTLRARGHARRLDQTGWRCRSASGQRAGPARSRWRCR